MVRDIRLSTLPMEFGTLIRMWINQPSSFQLLHRLHGANVIAQPPYRHDKTVTVYFTEGDVVSMLVPKECLTRGWN